MYEGDYMLDLLNKHKKTLFKYILVAFIASLLIVQIPYWIGKWWLIIPTDFEASDVLSFLGDFISAIGTILLGWYAIIQTDKANDTNDRLLAIEEQRYQEDHQPVIVVDSVILHNTSFKNTPLYLDANKQYDTGSRLYYVDAAFEKSVNEERACIEIKITNTGRTGIYNCQIKSISSVPEELKYGIQNIDSFHSASFSLSPSNSMPIHLYVYPNVIERFSIMNLNQIKITLECVNNYNEKYIIALTIKGDCELYSPRYEDMLVPTQHPVVWDVQYSQKE